MYFSALAGMYLCGIYGAMFLIVLVICWSDNSWSERSFLAVIVLFFGLGFGACENEKNKVLNRIPTISSCVSVGDGRFAMVDSTLRCKCGLEPRYTVVKSEAKLVPNEQSPCVNCGKTMVYHYDITCTETDEEREFQTWVDYMNAP